MKEIRDLTEAELVSNNGGNWFTWLLGYCWQGQYNSMKYNGFQASVMPYK